MATPLPSPERAQRRRAPWIVLSVVSGLAAIAAIGVIGAMGGPGVSTTPDQPIRVAQTAARGEADLRQRAEARFRERCAHAGESVQRIVHAAPDEGLALVARRLQLAGGQFSDRFRHDDAFGRACSLDDCIAGLLRVTFGTSSQPDEAARHARGFPFVEALDPRDLALYRHRAGIGVTHWRSGREIDESVRISGEEPGPAVYGFVVQREELDAFGARHGMTWDDITTPEDRGLGIAGSVLTVFELKSGDVVATRTGYTLRPLGGAPTSDGPGAGAIQACPAGAMPDASVDDGASDREFALRVLR